LLFTSLYQTFIDRNAKAEALKRLAFDVSGIGSLDYPVHSFDMTLNKFNFYYEAILDGCSFDRHDAGIMHSEINRVELEAVAHRLKEQPAFLFGEPVAEAKPLDPRKEVTLNCLMQS